VSLLATPESTASTLYGLFDVLGSVGIAWATFISGKPVEPRFDVRIVAKDREPFRCNGNVLVTPHDAVEDVGETDIALIAALNLPATSAPKEFDKGVCDWLIHQQSRGTMIASACTGAILLARTGMLNGGEATSHFAYRDLFRVYFPEVKMRMNQNLCVSGPHNRIVTSGGATAWQELALYLITKYCGVDHAIQTAKFWLIPGREELQASFASISKGISHEDNVVSKCQTWIAEHYGIENPVAAMVEYSGLPSTTFARRFKQATGYRPMEYVHALRVEEAKQMLETDRNAVDKIGREVGYEDPASFRRIFKRTVGLTPSIYRRKFGRDRFERLSQFG